MMCLPATFAFGAGHAGRRGAAAAETVLALAAPKAVLIIGQRTGAF